MKELLLSLILFALSHSMCIGQVGFSKTYRYEDTRHTEFFSILNDNDTLVIHGLAIDGSGNQGLLLTKIDTFGNVLFQRFYGDSVLSTPFLAEDGYDLIKTQEGGYIVTGELNFVSATVKLSENGDIDLITNYPINTEEIVSFYHEICTLEDGFMLGGPKQMRADFKADIFISQLNKNGDTLWEKRYGEIGIWDLMGEMLVLDDNNIVVGGWKGGNAWVQPWFFSIDNQGEILWEWLGEKSKKAGVVDDFVLTSDGEIIYLNTFIDTVVLIGEPVGFTRGRLVKLDSNRNEVWSTVVGKATFESNDLTDLVMTSEGDFVATGKYAPNEDGASGTALVNWTVKFSSEGEVLWERFDSTIWTPDRGVWNDPSGITLLSSGSIVICGTAYRLSAPDNGELGYIIKLDKNGCMEEGCELGPITRVDVPFGQNLEVLIYPNPASGSVTVEFPGRGDLILFDMQGRLMLTVSEAIDQVSLDMSTLLPGTYFVRIVTDAGWTVRTIAKE
ncbi:MAG: hypothetical protein DRI69_12160 [Bacteroidetes bacterium]|nr:MAG: hypothetical protein DRI69_12160 [Bacteroidota bacterium]